MTREEHRVYGAQHYVRNRGKYKARANAYYWKHRARSLRLRRIRYYKDPREFRAIRNRAYYERNREALIKKSRKDYIENRGRHNARQSKIQAKRRALILGATMGDLTAIAAIYKRARELRQWFDVVVDHIIPLCKGGSHSPGNLQIIYRIENHRKHARLDYQPSVVFA